VNNDKKPLDKEVHDSFLVSFYPVMAVILIMGCTLIFVVVASIARSFFTGEL
jgi:hypothetical protein